MRENKSKLTAKIIWRLVLFVLSFLLFVVFMLEQHGYANMKTFNALFSPTIKNPHDGIFNYDFDAIDNAKIRHSASIARDNNFSDLILYIEGSGASLLGYQLNSAIKSRFFTVCIHQANSHIPKNIVILKAGELGTSNADYCKEPQNGTDYTLVFKASLDGETLTCLNCEEFDYPSHWWKFK